MKQPPIQYTIPEVFKITKLPPGQAYGAGDLKKWNLRRMEGASGIGEKEIPQRQYTVMCKDCGYATIVRMSPLEKKFKKRSRSFRCSGCGKRNVKVRRGQKQAAKADSKPP